MPKKKKQKTENYDGYIGKYGVGASSKAEADAMAARANYAKGNVIYHASPTKVSGKK